MSRHEAFLGAGQNFCVNKRVLFLCKKAFHAMRSFALPLLRSSVRGASGLASRKILGTSCRPHLRRYHTHITHTHMHKDVSLRRRQYRALPGHVPKTTCREKIGECQPFWMDGLVLASKIWETSLQPMAGVCNLARPSLRRGVCFSKSRSPSLEMPTASGMRTP